MKTPEPKYLTDTIGGCRRRFQEVLFSLAILCPIIMAVWGTMFMTFGLYNPGWICLDEGNPRIVLYIRNASVAYTKIPSPGVPADETNLNDTTWSRNCYVRDSCHNLMYSRDSSSMVSHWDLSCDSAWIPSAIISIQMIGATIGSSVSGQINDRFGRKKSLYGLIAINCVSHLIASVSVSWQMYASAFFLIGFSSTGIIACDFPYPLEFLSEKWRGVLAALPIWNIGFTTFALAVIIWKDWRYLHITPCVIVALTFIPVFWRPESVGWLAVKGQTEHSEQLIARITRMNKQTAPDTSIIDDIADEEKIIMPAHRYTYVDLFRIPSIRGYSIKFGLIWISLQAIYFTISFGITVLSGDFFINLLLFTVFETPGVIFVAPAGKFLGRRKAALLFFGVEIITSTSLVVVCLATTGTVQNKLILLLLLLFKLTIGCAWSTILVFSSELYPTAGRGRLYDYLNAISHIGAVLSPHLIPQDPENVYSMFITIGVLVALIFGLVWTLPETKGRVLQDRIDETSSPRKDVIEESL